MQIKDIMNTYRVARKFTDSVRILGVPEITQNLFSVDFVFPIKLRPRKPSNCSLLKLLNFINFV